MSCAAEFLRRVLEKEKEGGMGFDPDVHAFLASCVHEGLAESPATHFIMRILGLEVCFACAQSTPDA